MAKRIGKGNQDESKDIVGLFGSSVRYEANLRTVASTGRDFLEPLTADSAASTFIRFRLKGTATWQCGGGVIVREGWEPGPLA